MLNDPVRAHFHFSCSFSSDRFQHILLFSLKIDVRFFLSVDIWLIRLLRLFILVKYNGRQWTREVTKCVGLRGTRNEKTQELEEISKLYAFITSFVLQLFHTPSAERWLCMLDYTTRPYGLK